MKFQNICFDLDGTLTDSGPGIRGGVRYALSHFGITGQTDAQLNRFIGPPLVDSFSAYYGFSEEQAKEAVRCYREYYLAVGIFENAPYDGIEACLSRLKETGASLFLVTSKPETMAKQVLEHFDLSHFFTDVCGAALDGHISAKAEVFDVLLSKHPSLREELHSVVMVGDREQDVLGAAAHGIPCIGVLWGYGSRAELSASGAARLVQTPAALAAYLAGSSSEKDDRSAI